MPDLSPTAAPQALRYAVLGGVYNNYLSLTAVLDEAERLLAARVGMFRGTRRKASAE